MLLQAENQNDQINNALTHQRVELRIHDLVSLYTTKDKVCRPYTFSQLDSQVGFQVNLIFSYKQVSVIGLLKYINGQSVRIPDVYGDLIVKKLQKTLEGRMKFSIMSEIGLLKVQSDTKFEISQSDGLNLLVCYIKQVIGYFPQIYSVLLSFGIVKKNQKETLNLIKQKLILLKSVSRILDSQENTIQKESVSVQYDVKKQGSVFRYYDKIQPFNGTQNKSQDALSQSQLENIIKQGGFSQVQKKKCQISQVFVSSSKTNKITTDLAIKTMRINQKNKFSTQQRIQKQYCVLNRIQDPKHTLNYWVKLTDPFGNIQNILNKWDDLDTIYIQYQQETIDDYIYYSRSKNIQDIIEYSKQIIYGVQILHNSGIVHRDLKPDNLMLGLLPNNQKCIKIIDFSQSVFIQSIYDEKISHTLGSTIPYSPIQCYLATKEGFNSSQIDLWSVGLILYELLYEKNPITYSKCFGMDIYKGWKIPNEFGVFSPTRSKGGIRLIEFIFGIIAVKSVCVEQKERMRLRKMSEILEQVSKFVNKIGDI